MNDFMQILFSHALTCCIPAYLCDPEYTEVEKITDKNEQLLRDMLSENEWATMENYQACRDEQRSYELEAAFQAGFHIALELR